MAMHIEPEPRPRLPAWLAVSLAGVGAGLGLWQVGAFDRTTSPTTGTYRAGLVGHANIRRGDPANVAQSAPPGNSIASADGAVSVAGSATHLEQLARDGESDVQAESAARLEALAAETASDP
jgi:hypothetical protein